MQKKAAESPVSRVALPADSNNLLSAGMWYTLRLKVENTGTGGAAFTLQILDRFAGALRVAKTATGATTLTAAGEVGLRFYSATGGAGEVIDVDNVRITENPPGLAAGGPRTAVAGLQGSGCKVTFYSQPDIDGVLQVSRETAVLSGGTWETLPTDEESLFLQYRESVSTFAAAQYGLRRQRPGRLAQSPRTRLQAQPAGGGCTSRGGVLGGINQAAPFLYQVAQRRDLFC